MKAAGVAVLLALAFPAQAAAQTPPVPVPVPTPAPVPAAGKLTLAAKGVLGGSRPVALRGHAFTLRGVVRPYIAGEKVVVRVYRNGKKIQVRALTPKPVAGGAAGVVKLKVGATKPGKLVIKASHAQTPALATLRAENVRVEVLRPSAGPGASGVLVRLLQARLARLHYVVPRSGIYDAGTSRAVIAFRKLTGMTRTAFATEDVFAALLKGRGGFKVRHPKDGHHVEARLNQQVLALVNGSKVERIYMISSGKPSTPTVQGRFHVYSKTPGTNAKGMVDSSYFIRGYAIHGYFDVPVFAASHGCLRVPIPNARAIYDWLRYGDVVWVEP